MAAHKRERKQAAVKVEFRFRVPRETDSRWDAVPIGCVQGLTLERVYVVLVLRCPRFTLVQVYVGTGLRWYRFTVEAGDAVTLRGC